MQNYLAPAVGTKEHQALCELVSKAVEKDRCVQRELKGRPMVQITSNEDRRNGIQCSQGIVDAVAAMAESRLNPVLMNKNAIIGFVATFLVAGGADRVASPPVAATPNKPEAAPIASKPAKEKSVKVAKPTKEQQALTKPVPAIITAAPLPASSPGANETPSDNFRTRREPPASESFCAAVVLSHLLITAAQLGAYDTDPGHEQRSEKLNSLLAEYQKVAEARINNWPKLHKNSNGKSA